MMADAKCECGKGQGPSLRSDVLAYAAEKYGTRPEMNDLKIDREAAVEQ